MRRAIALSLLALLFLTGCHDREERVIQAQHQCTDYGQQYIVAIESDNQTDVYCYTNSPCRIYKKVLS